jgi:S-adenosylmethionine hydrolase
MLLHLVADYGKGDLAFAEVIQALKYYIAEAEIITTPVPAFDTLSTGFVVGQLAREKGPERIIYHNTAPRKDDPKARRDNEGEVLAYAKSGNALIVGANAGYSFSFVKRDIHPVPCENKGSQFRSRDIFPEAIANLLREENTPRKNLLAPAVPDNSILYVDGYGNIKTSLAKEVLKEKELRVKIGEEIHFAASSDSAFARKEDTLVLTPGSSGGEDPYLELFLRGGSAHRLFKEPSVGSSIEIL